MIRKPFLLASPKGRPTTFRAWFARYIIAQPFVHFITASVKDVHPTAPSVGGMWLSPQRKVNTAKEIAYQQRRFLDFSKTLIDTQTWVTFLACVKHQHVANAYQLSAARFPEITDKKFWDELTLDVQATRAEAEKLLDNATIQEVTELCDYQSVADKISIAPETVKELRDLRARFQNLTDRWNNLWLLLAVVTAVIGGVAGGLDRHEEPERTLRIALIIAAVISGAGAVFLLIRGVISALQEGAQKGLRLRYSQTFESTIAPCLRLAHVDPATCTDNLDYVESVLNSVCERYRHLREKLLQPFL
jgi:hypothetical protein